MEGLKGCVDVAPGLYGLVEDIVEKCDGLLLGFDVGMMLKDADEFIDWEYVGLFIKVGKNRSVVQIVINNLQNHDESYLMRWWHSRNQ